MPLFIHLTIYLLIPLHTYSTVFSFSLVYSSYLFKKNLITKWPAGKQSNIKHSFIYKTDIKSPRIEYHWVFPHLSPIFHISGLSNTIKNSNCKLFRLKNTLCQTRDGNMVSNVMEITKCSCLLLDSDIILWLLISSLDKCDTCLVANYSFKIDELFCLFKNITYFLI